MMTDSGRVVVPFSVFLFIRVIMADQGQDIDLDSVIDRLLEGMLSFPSIAMDMEWTRGGAAGQAGNETRRSSLVAVRATLRRPCIHGWRQQLHCAAVTACERAGGRVGWTSSVR